MTKHNSKNEQAHRSLAFASDRVWRMKAKQSTGKEGTLMGYVTCLYLLAADHQGKTRHTPHSTSKDEHRQTQTCKQTNKKKYNNKALQSFNQGGYRTMMKEKGTQRQNRRQRDGGVTRSRRRSKKSSKSRRRGGIGGRELSRRYSHIICIRYNRFERHGTV